MKFRMFLFALAAIFATSCGLSGIGDALEDNVSSGGIWGGPVEDAGTGGLEQVCYITAVDYRKDYDWLSDQAAGTVRCSLVVYAGGRPVMKVPVGDIYETSADPDMHRIIDGHLYTDYSTDSETVVRKDGNLLFRYPGRESVCGMQQLDEGLYTLGQNRDGVGFSYRRDGEVLLARETGTVMGALRNRDDTLSFAFYDAIHSSDGDIGRYYVVNDGKVSQVAVREDIRKVWDIVCVEAGVIYLASVVGVSAPVLFMGESMRAIQLPSGAVILSASLVCTSDVIGAEIIYLVGNAMYTSLWVNGSVQRTFPKGMTTTGLCPLDRGVCCAANPADRTETGMIYRNGELYSMPETYFCMGDDAMSMVNGILHVGLSSKERRNPLVWKDGQTDTLDINGYITSVVAY